MEYVYHGSKIQGLKKLKTRSGTHRQEWVYATPSKAVALIFISNRGWDLNYRIDGNGTKEKPLILTERKPGMFDEIYNISGSLYTLKGNNFKSGRTSWNAEVVSEFEEEIVKEEQIDNILEKIVELSEKVNSYLTVIQKDQQICL